MAPYKPKRFEGRLYEDRSYSLGINIATERYCNEDGCFRDIYLSLSLILGGFTIVLFRMKK